MDFSNNCVSEEVGSLVRAMPGVREVQVIDPEVIDPKGNDSSQDDAIDFESQDLTSLDISNLKSQRDLCLITELNLDYNKLTNLPDELGSALPNLRTLRVCGNELRQLSSSTGMLQRLEILCANENEIHTLPTSLFSLSELKELHLLGNHLEEVHCNINQLRNLESLTLEDNQLQSLPHTLGELSNLRILEASENSMDHLPDNLGDLQKLSVLNVSGNQLIDLPESFGNLPSLQCVDLSRNRLTKLSPILHSASACLRVFHASDNFLTVLPAWMGELAHIEELVLANNTINQECALPDHFGAVSGKTLRRMDLGTNQLEELPSTMGQLVHLESLHLGSHIPEIERRAFTNGNAITYLPDSFSHMTNLRYVRLDENQLHSLPDNFGDLQNLDYLDLGQNMLRELPSSFCRLRSLKTCLLTNNHIEYLPEDFGDLQTLERLRIKTNQLTELPASFCRLVNLRTLDLVDNLLEEFPRCLNQLTNLVRVALDDNKFELDIPEVYNLDAPAQYPKDGIHKFVRTTTTTRDDTKNNMTAALATALKQGASIGRSHVTNGPSQDSSEQSVEDTDCVSNGYISDAGASSTEGESQHGSEIVIEETENWDLELEDNNPFSDDVPEVYKHTQEKRSPIGRSILNFLFVPSDEHPPPLPVYDDIPIDPEDGQFDDVE